MPADMVRKPIPEVTSDESPEEIMRAHAALAVYRIIQVMRESRDPRDIMQSATYILDRVLGKARPAADQRQALAELAGYTDAQLEAIVAEAKTKTKR